jgi:hypothetical protein
MFRRAFWPVKRVPSRRVGTPTWGDVAKHDERVPWLGSLPFLDAAGAPVRWTDSCKGARAGYGFGVGFGWHRCLGTGLRTGRRGSVTAPGNFPGAGAKSARALRTQEYLGQK